MVSGDLIREARMRAGLTQAELGQRIEQAQSVIARWESGRVTPSLETVRRVVRACGLDMHFSLSRADDSSGAIIDNYLAMSAAERFSELLARTRLRERRAHLAADRGA